MIFIDILKLQNHEKHNLLNLHLINTCDLLPKRSLHLQPTNLPIRTFHLQPTYIYAPFIHNLPPYTYLSFSRVKNRKIVINFFSWEVR